MIDTPRCLRQSAAMEFGGPTGAAAHRQKCGWTADQSQALRYLSPMDVDADMRARELCVVLRQREDADLIWKVSVRYAMARYGSLRAMLDSLAVGSMLQPLRDRVDAESFERLLRRGGIDQVAAGRMMRLAAARPLLAQACSRRMRPAGLARLLAEHGETLTALSDAALLEYLGVAR